MTGQRQQFTQLLRASVAQGGRREQARPGRRESSQQARVGVCAACGAPVAAHYDGRNRMLGCRHAQRVGA